MSLGLRGPWIMDDVMLTSFWRVSTSMSTCFYHTRPAAKIAHPRPALTCVSFHGWRSTLLVPRDLGTQSAWWMPFFLIFFGFCGESAPTEKCTRGAGALADISCWAGAASGDPCRPRWATSPRFRVSFSAATCSLVRCLRTLAVSPRCSCFSFLGSASADPCRPCWATSARFVSSCSPGARRFFVVSAFKTWLCFILCSLVGWLMPLVHVLVLVWGAAARPLI